MYTFTLSEAIHGFKMSKTFNAFNPNKVSMGFGNNPSTAELCIKRWLKTKIDEGYLNIHKSTVDELRFIVKPEHIKIVADEEIIPAGTIIEYDIPCCKNKGKSVIHFIDSPLLYL